MANLEQAAAMSSLFDNRCNVRLPPANRIPEAARIAASVFLEGLSWLRGVVSEFHEEKNLAPLRRVSTVWGDADPARDVQLRRLRVSAWRHLVAPARVLLAIAKHTETDAKRLNDFTFHIDARPPTLAEVQDQSIDGEVLRIVEAGETVPKPAEVFTPLAFTDPSNGKTYKFDRPLLWELWKALWPGKRRWTYNDLPDQVPHWKDAPVTDDAFSQAVKDLRSFWKEQGRKDLADRITVKRRTVGFDGDTGDRFS